MVHDLLIHSGRYEKLHPHFAAAFNWLRNFDTQTPDGRYEIVGANCVAGVQRYSTKATSEKKWEAHREFGDIQVVFHGEEICGHTDRNCLLTQEPYSAEKDVEKFSAPNFKTSQLILRMGYFTIFYPQDAHQPGVALAQSSEVLKVVIKFKLN